MIQKHKKPTLAEVIAYVISKNPEYSSTVYVYSNRQEIINCYVLLTSRQALFHNSHTRQIARINQAMKSRPDLFNQKLFYYSYSLKLPITKKIYDIQYLHTLLTL